MYLDIRGWIDDPGKDLGAGVIVVVGFFLPLTLLSPLVPLISTLGACILQLYVPGSNGRIDDVVLGCASLQEYANGTSPYFGAIVGRCANRIAKAEVMGEGFTARKERQLFIYIGSSRVE